MKKGAKLGLGIGALLLSTVILSGCTASFCSTLDKAHMMYAFDYGVSSYSSDSASGTQLSVNGTTYDIYVNYSLDNCVSLKGIVETAAKSDIATPSINYWAKLDQLVVGKVLARATTDGYDVSTLKSDVSSESSNKTSLFVEDKDNEGSYVDILKEYGYLKFYYDDEGGEEVSYFHTGIRWENWDNLNEMVRSDTSLSVSDLASVDFVNSYKTQMNKLITSYRSCLATNDGKYGYYGASGERYPIAIEAKNYGYAWHRGFLEGLLIWPIGALTDVVGTAFGKSMPQGVASMLAIFVITFIVRSFMLLFTFGQQAQSAKMNELQPEIAKIQSKYPNANTSNTEKARLAQETQALYKKHNVHPFRSILTMFIQFPVFICVWGALSGSAVLSTGSLLGLNLSSSISSVLFSASNWSSFNAGGPMALILFILMAGAQTIAMLLPQWIQKRKQKKVVRLGKNPAQTQQNKTMKIFTYVMLAMIILMGFSLASGMGIYWVVSALFSVAQTLITQAIVGRKKKEKKH